MIDLTRRDESDSNREIGQLKKADDVRVLNTTSLDFDEQLYLIMKWIYIKSRAKLQL